MGKRFVNLPETDRLAALDTVQAVVIEQPHKIPLLAGSIQIANSTQSSIGKIVVESFHGRIQEAADKGQWNKFKLLSRFIATLFPIIGESGAGVFKLLNVTLDRAIELQKQSGETRSPLGEELYTSVLLTIPYLISSISLQETAEEVKGAIKGLIIKSRDFTIVENQSALNVLTPFSGDKVPYESKNFVKLVRDALDNIAETLSVPKLINIPFLIEQDLHRDAPLVQHVFPAVSLAENVSQLAPYTGTAYQTPRLFFSVYLPEILETVPPVGTLPSLLFRDVSCDIISNMDFNRKEVARQLITLDLFFEKGTFTEPGIVMDRLQALQAANPSESTWKVEDVALEAILEELFKLPTSNFYGSYFHVILIESCIMAPQAIAPVFGRAIRFLYSTLTDMDVELRNRFLDWFSHHLSNFGFSWKWQEWKDDASLPDLHPRKVFMQQLIIKEVRLSYAQRVRESLPEELVSWVPVIPEEPVFKYLEPESQYQNEVQKLVSLLRESGAKEDIDTLLSEISEKANGLEEENATQLVVDIVMSTIVYLGNRSISHAESWITKSKDLLLDVLPNDYTKAVNAVLEYWKSQPYVGLLVITQLIKQEILPPSAFIISLFDKDLQSLLYTNHGWEMLVRTLDSVVNHKTLAATEKEKVFKELIHRFGELIDQQTTTVDEEAGEVEEDVLNTKETNRWALRWSQGTIKSLLRKYYTQLQGNTLGDDVTNAYVKDLLAAVRAI